MNVMYLELDSTYRNRELYPNPGEFTVNVNQNSIVLNSARQSGINAVDPILDSFPEKTWTGNVLTHTSTFNGGNSNFPILGGLSLSTNGIYNGLILKNVTSGESSLIIGYNGILKSVVLISFFNKDNWNPNDTYEINDPSTNNKIFIENGSDRLNFYKNNILYDVTIDEYRIITKYNPVTKIATLESPFSGAWNINDTYEIRRNIPITAGSTNIMTFNTINISPIGSSNEDDYIGNYIRFSNGNLFNETRRITNYDALTQTIKFAPNIETPSILPVKFEILSFTKDNVNDLNITGVKHNNKHMYYEIELIDLVVPNITLSNGSRLAFYPYIYVMIKNKNNGTNNYIHSNNPESVNALFRCPVYDLSSPILSKYVKLNSDMKHKIIFTPYQDIEFKIFLPNGETIEIDDSNLQPIFPDIDLQVSCCLKLKSIY